MAYLALNLDQPEQMDCSSYGSYYDSSEYRLQELNRAKINVKKQHLEMLELDEKISELTK